MLPQAIHDFPSQFAFEPLIENSGKLKSKKKFLVCGMGGSQVYADVLRSARPELDIAAYRDYGLPLVPDLADRLIILSSYSGNTEEVIEAFEAALEKGLAMAVLAKGGRLVQLARQHKVPFVVVPDTGIQPRQATGFMLRGLMALIGDRTGLNATRQLVASLDAGKFETEGRTLARKMKGQVPVIYASGRNEVLSRSWKIKFNENGKVPAFFNVFPELNHNEMTGFDAIRSTRPLSANFHFILLDDPADHDQNRKRVRVTARLLEKRKLHTTTVEVPTGERYETIFRNLLLADWTTYHTALIYGTEPELVPMVEEFKNLI